MNWLRQLTVLDWARIGTIVMLPVMWIVVIRGVRANRRARQDSK